MGYAPQKSRASLAQGWNPLSQELPGWNELGCTKMYYVNLYANQATKQPSRCYISSVAVISGRWLLVEQPPPRWSGMAESLRDVHHGIQEVHRP